MVIVVELSTHIRLSPSTMDCTTLGGASYGADGVDVVVDAVDDADDGAHDAVEGASNCTLPPPFNLVGAVDRFTKLNSAATRSTNMDTPPSMHRVRTLSIIGAAAVLIVAHHFFHPQRERALAAVFQRIIIGDREGVTPLCCCKLLPIFDNKDGEGATGFLNDIDAATRAATDKPTAAIFIAMSFDCANDDFWRFAMRSTIYMCWSHNHSMPFPSTIALFTMSP